MLRTSQGVGIGFVVHANAFLQTISSVPMTFSIWMLLLGLWLLPAVFFIGCYVFECLCCATRHHQTRAWTAADVMCVSMRVAKAEGGVEHHRCVLRLN